REGSDAPPISLVGIGGRQQQQQLRLEWVGVLELVDEEMRPARLQPPPYTHVVADEVARPQEQVDEVETAGATLQPFGVLPQRPQVVSQQGRELGSGAAHEIVELELRRCTTRPAGGPLGITIAKKACPLPVPLTRQRPQLGLETVVVTSRDLLATRHVGDEAL